MRNEPQFAASSNRRSLRHNRFRIGRQTTKPTSIRTETAYMERAVRCSAWLDGSRCFTDSFRKRHTLRMLRGSRNEEDNRESNNGRCNAHGNTSTQNGNKRERTGYNDEHATVLKNCARKGPTTHGADVEHTQEQRDNQAEHQVR